MAKVGKGFGGSSHDRAIARTAGKVAVESSPPAALQPDKSVAATNLPVQASERISISERVLRFLDSGSTQTLAGIVGGIAGTFLDGRYYCVLCVLTSLGLKRSKALDGLKKQWILPIHIGVMLAFGSVLFLIGIQFNKWRPQTFTPSDWVAAVKNNMPLPVNQQITNVYKSYQAKSKVGPVIDFSEFTVDGADDNHIFLHTDAVNDGDAPALDVEGSAFGLYGDMGQKTEDSLFSDLQKHTADLAQPRRDDPPGVKYQMSERLSSPGLSPQQWADVQAGRTALYLGRIDRYRDSRGNRYESEICMYLTNARSLMFCDGHNFYGRKLGNGGS
jgi:hypothetical protein